jgi:hypothetical protein
MFVESPILGAIVSESTALSSSAEHNCDGAQTLPLAFSNLCHGSACLNMAFEKD